MTRGRIAHEYEGSRCSVPPASIFLGLGEHPLYVHLGWAGVVATTTIISTLPRAAVHFNDLPEKVSPTYQYFLQHLLLSPEHVVAYCMFDRILRVNVRPLGLEFAN